MNDDFIQIPLFLTEGNDNLIETEISPFATCDGKCMDFCEHYDECCGYEKCMASCQDGSCQTSCEKGCQNGEGGCSTTCEKNCQNCEGSCQTTCESNCQLTCEFACQYACENFCMTGCESCETACQGTCLDACQACEGVCQTSCEIHCENCQTTCQKYCQTSCQLGCQSSGQTNPKLPPPTLDTTKTIKTGNSISITINTVMGAEIYYARINGGSQQSSSERTFIFHGLTPLTQYLIEVKVSGTGYQDSDWSGYTATTLEATLWEWWEPKDVGMGFNVSDDEWLAFCNQINQVRISKGLLAYPFTTDPVFIAPGKDYYAWIFLQACNAINQIKGQVAAELLNVKSNDDIYAWYFENLKTTLNNAATLP